MQMRQRDEEKRSKLWVAVLLGSTAVILLVVAFFATKPIWNNPLEGEWVAKEKGYYLDIDDDNDMTVEGTFDGVLTEIDLKYTIDKDEKIISIKGDAQSYAEAADEADDEITPNELNESVSELVTSFYYSIESDTLTLTERESGDQFIFTRIKK